MQGTTVKAAEQAEYTHPKHKDYHLRDLVTAAVNPDLSVHLGRLEPGGEIYVHTHDTQTETFHILSGQAVCTMGDKKIEYGPGTCGTAPPGIPHGLKNEGQEPVVLMAMFTPPLK